MLEKAYTNREFPIDICHMLVTRVPSGECLHESIDICLIAQILNL
jgi:hypothetical protein